jgi:hypothetical protein
MVGVKDGRSLIDKDFQKQLMQLDANFEAVWDSESPILEYLIAAFEESSSGSADVTQISQWVTAAAFDRRTSVFLGTPLGVGRKYYVSVKAKNAAGHVAICNSDGVRIDTVPPHEGTVQIGFGSDQAIDAKTGFLPIFIQEFNDKDSGIESFFWRVLESETFKTIAAGSLQGDGHVVFAKVKLKAGKHYEAQITARDLAGNEISSSSGAILAVLDDFYVPDWSKLLHLVPNTFQSVQQATTYILEIILPWLKSEAYRSNQDFRWCLSSKLMQDDSKTWMSLTGDRIVDFDNILLDSVFSFFVGVQVKSIIGTRRSTWIEYLIDKESARCMSDPCLWILGAGGGIGSRYISSQSFLTCKFDRIHDFDSGIELFIVWPTCKIESRPDKEEQYGAVMLSSVREYKFAGLALEHGSMCRCNMLVYDVAGNSREFTSTFAAVDLTPPSACIISNFKWYSNPSGAVIFTLSDSTDLESGIARLTLQVIKSSPVATQEEQVLLEQSASAGPNVVFSDQFESGVSLSFHIRVQAVNKAGRSVTSIGQHFQFDSSPPFVSHFQAGKASFGSGHHYFQSSCLQIEVEFNCSDLESGIDESKSELAVGRYAGDTTTLQWLRPDSKIISGLNLGPGIPFFVSIRCRNTAGLEAIGTPGVIVCDQSPPKPIRVVDGFQGLQSDFSFWGNSRSVAFSSRFDEAESEVTKIYASLATKHCNEAPEPDVIAWVEIDHAQSGNVYWLHSDAPLLEERYFVWAKAQNLLGMNSTIDCSDGFELVLSSPTCQQVWNTRDMSDQQYSFSRQSITASWNCTSKVGFDSFLWEVVKVNDTGEEVIASRRLSGLREYVATNLIKLEENRRYQSRITGFDKLGGKSESQNSALFLVDTSPPIIDYLRMRNPNRIGKESVDNSLLFTANSTHVSFSFVVHDLESGISRCQWRLVRYSSMAAVTDFADFGSRSFVDGIFAVGRLDDGSYAVQVGCINNAGLDTHVASPAFVLDTTEPFCGNPELRCHFPSGFYSQSGYPLKIDSVMCKIEFSDQRAHDRESGISSLQTSIVILSKIGGSPGEVIVPATRELQIFNLTLFNGTDYACVSTCINHAGLHGESCMSPPLTILLGNLVPGDVIDGFETRDIDFQTHEHALFFRFDHFQDPMKQPLTYEWAAGTSLHTDDVFPWQPANNFGSVQHSAYLHRNELPLGQRIFAHVRASSGSRSANSSSNGVIVVASALRIHWVLCAPSRTSIFAPPVCEWSMRREPMPLQLFLKFGTTPGGDELQEWRRVNESETLMHDMATIPAFKEGKHHGRRVWVGLCVKSSQLQITSTLNNITSGLMYDISAPQAPPSSPTINCLKQSQDQPFACDVLRSQWSSFTDDESLIREYEACLDVLDPAVLTQTLDPMCVKMNESTLSHDFPLHLNMSSIVLVRVIATNSANLSTTASSRTLLIDKSPPDCSGSRTSTAVFHRNDLDSTLILSTAVIEWDPCFDNESGVSYNVAIRSYNGTLKVRKTMQPLGYSEAMQIRHHVINLGIIPNGENLIISVEAASDGGIINIPDHFIRIDYTAPVLGPVKLVTDSGEEGYHARHDFVAATWPCPLDNESRIISCDVFVCLAHAGASRVLISSVPVDSRGIESFGTWFVRGQTYRLALVCKNEQGLMTEASSQHFLVPFFPSVGTILHGEYCSSIPVVQNASVIHACWPYIEAGGAGIRSILWCVGSKPEGEDICRCQKTSELHGKAILRPDSRISEYFVTVIVVSTAGINSTRVSSLVQVDDKDPTPGVVDILSSAQSTVFNCPAAGFQSISSEFLGYSASLVRDTYLKVDWDTCVCIKFSGFRDNMDLARYEVSVLADSEAVSLQLPVRAPPQPHLAVCLGRDVTWRESTIYTAQVMAFDRSNRTCVSRRQFKIDLQPPSVEIFDVKLIHAHGQSFVYFNLTANDHGSEIAKILYRFCPVHNEKCNTEYTAISRPSVETCCDQVKSQPLGLDNFIDGHLYHVHVTVSDVVARVAVVASSELFLFDLSPPTFGHFDLISTFGSPYARSGDDLKILLDPVIDVQSGLSASNVCVGSFARKDEIMKCTQLENLIPCAPTSAAKLCFLVFPRSHSPTSSEIVAFYEATNGAGVSSSLFSDPITIDYTPPRIQDGAISIHHPALSIRKDPLCSCKDSLIQCTCKDSLCGKLPPRALLNYNTPEFELHVDFSSIWDPESGIRECLFAQVPVNLSHDNHEDHFWRSVEIPRQESRTSLRYNRSPSGTSTRSSKIDLSSLFIMDERIAYKIIVRVINKAGLATTIETQEFAWESTAPECPLPSSLNDLTAAHGLHYIRPDDHVQFQWANSEESRRYFSVTTCTFQTLSDTQSIVIEKCDSPVYIGNSTSFHLGSDRLNPGMAVYIELCLIHSNCQSSCRDSNVVVVENEIPGRVEEIQFTSVRAQDEAWSMLSDYGQNWSVGLRWKVFGVDVKSCAICLFNEDGAQSAPKFCQSSDPELDHGRINIVDASGSLSSNYTSAFYRAKLAVQITTFSNRVFMQFAEILTLDLTAPIGSFELFRVDRTCFEYENCRQALFEAVKSDELVFQSSNTTLRSRIVVTDPESGVQGSSWSVVRCTSDRQFEQILPSSSVPEDGMLLANDLSLSTNESYCFHVKSQNKQGLVSHIISLPVKVISEPPPFCNVRDGLEPDDVDWINTTETVACSWAVSADVGRMISHFELRILQKGGLPMGQCEVTGVNLESSIATERVDSNAYAHTLRVNLAHTAKFYCSLSVCGFSGLCITSISDGFTVDTKPPALGCLLVTGAKAGTQDSYDYTFLSRHSLLLIQWVSPTETFHLPEAINSCPSLGLNQTSNDSLVLDDEAPVESFGIFISYRNLSWDNMTFEGNQSSLVISTSQSDWLLLANLAASSGESPVDHSLSLELSEESRLRPNQLYYLMVTATKASGAFASSFFTNFMYDDSEPNVGDIAEIPLFASNDSVHIELNLLSNNSQLQSMGSDIDWISGPASVLKIEWNNFQDPESGIDRYLVCLGTSPYVCDVSDMVDVGLSQAYLSSPAWQQAKIIYATVTACNRAIPSLCQNQSSDGIGLDMTPPRLLEVNDGYEEGIDWQQQGFQNSIFGNWRAVDDVSDISEYEWLYQVAGDIKNLSEFVSVGSSRVGGWVGRRELETVHALIICARAVNHAGLRSSVVCSDGLSKGKTDIAVTKDGKEAMGFGVDRLYESTTDESIAPNTTVFVSIVFPNNSVSSDTRLIAGPLMKSEYINSSFEDPALMGLRTAPNMKVGNHSFVLKVADAPANDGFSFLSPIKISLYFDIGKIISDVGLGDRVIDMVEVPSLLLRNVSSGRWTNAADTCTKEMLTRAGIEERWSYEPDKKIFNVHICHLTQFAIAFQKPPVAHIENTTKVYYPDHFVVLNGSASRDPDGNINSYMWRILFTSDPGVVIENPGSQISKLTNLMPGGSCTIELTVEDNDYATSSCQTVVTMVGPSSNLRFSTQPSSCGVAGKPLEIQPTASIHDRFGSLFEKHLTLNLSASLMQVHPQTSRNLTIADSNLWQARVPHVMSSGYVSISDLVIFKSGSYALRLSTDVLDSVTSAPFIIVPGAAQILNVNGIESGCFKEHSVLSTQLRFLVTDSHDNAVNISRFAVFARVLESQKPLLSFTAFTYSEFKVNYSFCGHILFEINLTQAVGCNFYATDLRLQAVSQPLCVVSPCNPGEVREACSAFSAGICSLCSSGKYAIADDECLDCPAGKYSTAVGASSSAVCQECVAGKYLTTQGNSDPSDCLDCECGKYSTTSAATAMDTCVECVAGKYGPGTGNDEESDCEMCLAGTYLTVAGQCSDYCIDCDAGKYLTTKGNDEAKDCEDCDCGKYSTAQGATVIETCVECVAGKYAVGVGNTDCERCAAGKYSQMTSQCSTACIDCDAGKFSPTDGNNEASDCLDCVGGKYRTGAGGVACDDCAAGKHSGSTGQTDEGTCSACQTNSDAPAGAAYCSCNAGFTKNDDAECVACAAGKYQSATGGCTKCSAGKYSAAVAATGESACSACPANSNAPEGSDALSDCTCDIGYTGSNGDTCEICEAGKYKEVSGPGACIDCASGKYSPFEGVPTCMSCPTNSDSPPGSSVTSDCSCKAGYYKNSGACRQCPEGKFKEQVGDEACSNCAAGKYSTKVGQISASKCVLCEAGKYSETAGRAEGCWLCDAGKYSRQQGAETSGGCQDCPSDTTSAAGSDDDGDCTEFCAPGWTGSPGTCTLCPIGTHKTETGSGSCLPCPKNSDSVQEGQSLCTCNAGYERSGGAGGACQGCVAGKYKETHGDGVCSRCDAGSFSLAIGSTSQSTCLLCEAGKYSVGVANPCADCPANSISPVGSYALSDCTCVRGYTGSDGATCNACQEGTYKIHSGPNKCIACARGKYSAVLRKVLGLKFYNILSYIWYKKY